ncbi:1-acyl-sn-glycerol-3-phosphate acyltransferase [Sinimarinibacterium sp. NLF-5-8]|uniref:1-acyl-sn-glycerol-3-phosphate acyltransferase n=1 Tax=Sinimarinibacterium sp. NLF-5-8 TaxID=2698684 RepID=UPI00137BCCFD|nr:1-acyl-sn-glycerol-3-phosphate acyltransferase [Sinimarinibacterium sp. NLF-5-8]QHS10799.1 acyl-phosphate glycerol 3-phosphate acyltransferase [Sinimarinibacterium sp. NLF-5-8]
MTPMIGDQVPRRGNAVSRALARLLMWLMGWKFAGEVPNLPKMVLIGAPHTSNMDGVLGLLALSALGIQGRTMIKDSAFKGLMGAVLRWFGAIPVDRSSPKGVVGQTVDLFNRESQFVLLIAPEGTRSGAPEWKKGFYHVAKGAGVPVVPAAANYQTRQIIFGRPLVPGDDLEADMQVLYGFYAQQGCPRHPDRLSRPLCEATGRVWQDRPRG